MNFNSIENIVKEKLCHNCGMCYSVCPADAISLPLNIKRGTFDPIIRQDKCLDCGICLQSCSGKGLNFGEMYQQFFNCQPVDPWLGVHKEILTSFSSDKELQYSASSGGSLTALLIYLIGNKKFDGAIVTRFSPDNPLIPETIIATEIDDLKKAVGSKYCPVPANSALKEVLRKKGRYIFVGTPCQIQSLRLGQQNNSKLREAIPLVLGLLCSNTSTIKGTEYFLKKKEINKANIREFQYRGSGWLGSIKVKLDDEVKLFEKNPKKLRDRILHSVSFHTSFSLLRCLNCCDHMAEFADISFGDPRYKHYLKEEKVGKTLVIIRSEIGERYYSKAVENGAIVNHLKIKKEDFYKGQNINFKKSFLSNTKFNQILTYKNPQYTFIVPKPATVEVTRILKYLPSYLPKNRVITSILFFYGWLFQTVFNKSFYKVQIVNIIKMIKHE